MKRCFALEALSTSRAAVVAAVWVANSFCNAVFYCFWSVCMRRTYLLYKKEKGVCAMSRLNKSTLLFFAVATLLGSCLHFVHALFPNPVTALFSPVNESLWEHLKLLYWPCLVSALLLCRREPERFASRALALVLLCAAMLVVGYVYHVALGGESLFFDVALYVLLMAAFFVLPCIWAPIQAPALRFVALLALVLLGAAILFWSFRPPVGILFTDLSA